MDVVKRSGRDEPIWVEIYMFMETTKGPHQNKTSQSKLLSLHNCRQAKHYSL
jgi:hypothetical protein